MFNFDSMITRQRKWMLYWLAILVLCAGFLPYTRIFLGLILGSSISLYNLWLLQYKSEKLGKTIAAGEKARTGLGTFSRMAAAVLAVVVAIRFEEYFHLYAVIFGIVSSYLMMAVDVIVYQIAMRKRKED
ncbi:ATP synthase subunit I [Oceanobacillus sojae]|uniref:ATP synthase subunit I n=1 Tax=Oceanobacillus sojae TaxID=582851 RepID=UPI0021A79132|nr:ATP synthase subunit I [Oceanobacillus sojae]MCT1901173.1 ATP synthase subunit I [Oceanobacillus sojae]